MAQRYGRRNYEDDDEEEEDRYGAAADPEPYGGQAKRDRDMRAWERGNRKQSRAYSSLNKLRAAHARILEPTKPRLSSVLRPIVGCLCSSVGRGRP